MLTNFKQMTDKSSLLKENFHETHLTFCLLSFLLKKNVINNYLHNFSEISTMAKKS